MSLASLTKRPLVRGVSSREPLWRVAGMTPSLDLNFASTRSLVDQVTGQNLVTFTRASAGTFVDNTGTLRTATTNLLLRSEEFDDAAWTKVRTSVTANATASPLGTVTADKIVEDTSNNTHIIQLQGNTAVISGTTYTYSWYFKRAERTVIRVAFGSDAGVFNNQTLDLDLTTGSLTNVSGFGTTPLVSSQGNDWWRLSATVTALASATPTIRGLLIASGLTSYTGDGTSGLFLWGAQLEASSTVGEYIPTTSTINSAPRFDHNPTTGQCLGLLVEEARTNSIRNNTMQGAAAGTPGTLPTNWIAAGAGLGTLTQQVVGTGTQNGVNYIDIRVSGTTSTVNVGYAFDANTAIAALNGQSWTASSYIALVGGSVSNLTVNLRVNERTAAGAVITNSANDVTSSLTSALVRYTHLRTLNQATTAFVSADVLLAFSSGVAIDITLRIGLPQLEQGPFATSVIPTTGTAATRSADVATITGSNFSRWIGTTGHTAFAEWRPIATALPTGATQPAFEIGDSIASNFIRIFQFQPAGALVSCNSFSSGVNPGRLDSGGVYTDARVKAVCSSATSDRALSVNGGAAVTSAVGALPIGMNQLLIGSQVGGAYLNGTITRLTYWPARLSNATLQALTR